MKTRRLKKEEKNFLFLLINLPKRGVGTLNKKKVIIMAKKILQKEKFMMHKYYHEFISNFHE